jgi:hypothetical protein
MEHTFEELKKKTVSELREIAAGIDSSELEGYTQLNKEHLLTILCKALNIEMHAHHEVVGLDKTRIKTKIKELKKKRDEAIAAHDHSSLKNYRRRIKNLKKTLRRSTV